MYETGGTTVAQLHESCIMMMMMMMMMMMNMMMMMMMMMMMIAMETELVQTSNVLRFRFL